MSIRLSTILTIENPRDYKVHLARASKFPASSLLEYRPPKTDDAVIIERRVLLERSIAQPFAACGTTRIKNTAREPLNTSD